MSRSRAAGGRRDGSDGASGEPIPVAPAGTSTATCTDAEPFALRVTDDSMAPEFLPGCIVIVDPSVPPADGRFAVAETAAGVALGRVQRTAGGWQLQTLAADRPPLNLDAAAIRGVVTQRAGRRRRDHKRYP